MDHAFSDSGCRDRDLLDLEVQQEAPRRPQDQLRIVFNFPLDSSSLISWGDQAGSLVRFPADSNKGKLKGAGGVCNERT